VPARDMRPVDAVGTVMVMTTQNDIHIYAAPTRADSSSAEPTCLFKLSRLAGKRKKILGAFARLHFLILIRKKCLEAVDWHTNKPLWYLKLAVSWSVS
jgi:hypothetical protein